jgi:hypothetical protein
MRTTGVGPTTPAIDHARVAVALSEFRRDEQGGGLRRQATPPP